MLRPLLFVLFLCVSGIAQAKIVKGYSLSCLLKSHQLNSSEAFWLNSAGPLNRSTGVVGARGLLGFLDHLVSASREKVKLSRISAVINLVI